MSGLDRGGPCGRLFLNSGLLAYVDTKRIIQKNLLDKVISEILSFFEGEGRGINVLHHEAVDGDLANQMTDFMMLHARQNNQVSHHAFNHIKHHFDLKGFCQYL